MPGSTVPVKVLREKKERTLSVTVEQLDLDAENQTTQTKRGSNNQNNDTGEHESSGFGVTLNNLSPQVARRLQLPANRQGALISDVDPDGPAAGSGVRAGDVILQINRKPVSNAADASRELHAVPSGRLAQILLWRGDAEVFVTVKKD